MASSASHQVADCVSTEQCVALVPRVSGEQCIASDSASHQRVRRIRECVASGSGLHQLVYYIGQCVATDSTSHQAAYCISAEHTSREDQASIASSASHQSGAVRCVRQCISPGSACDQIGSGSASHQVVRCIRGCIASGSACHQIASDSASHQAVGCIRQCVATDSTSQQTVHCIRQRIVSVRSNASRQDQGSMVSSVLHPS